MTKASRKPSLPAIWTRRRFCRTVGLSLAAAVSSSGAARAAATGGKALPTLGFSLYGMKGLPLDEALQTCAELGYDDVEFALMPGFHADPEQLPAARRREIRKQLDALGLRLPALMDNLPVAAADEAQQAAYLDRIARAAELGYALVPERPPLLETILGGKPADWEKLREPLVDRLRQWAEAARKHDLLIAVKPHVSNALHLPDDAVWLVEQVDSPHIRLAYDYSHYEAQGLSLDKTLDRLVGRTVFIHVKDGRRVDGKSQFLLPGEGDVDYAAYFRQLAMHGYGGSVTVEVSGMIHQKPGYDPRAAAKQCYRALSTAWELAGLPKRAE